MKPLLLFSAQLEAKHVVLFLVALRPPLACRYGSTENRVMVGWGRATRLRVRFESLTSWLGCKWRVEPPQNPSARLRLWQLQAARR